MRDPEDRNTPRPSNVFAPEFLARLEEQDEPLTAAQAEAAGPWHVEPIPSPGWAVLPKGQSLARGDRPTAVFRHRERALLVAAVLPGSGFDRLFHIAHERSPEGYAVVAGAGGEIVGYLEHFDPDLVAALHTAEALIRLPECLTHLLSATGGVALARVGRLLELAVPAS
jgi:hypothetical protein